MNEQVKKDGELLFYARAGMTEKVFEALENGARIDAESGDSLRPTALHAAAYGGHADTVEALLRAGASPDMRNVEGGTPLFCAVLNLGLTASPEPRRQADVMEALLRHGADPDLGTTDDFRPLQCAALLGETAMIELLLDYGADANAAERDGNTALHRALSRGHLDAAEALLKRKADPLIENAWGETAQSMARNYGLDSVLDLMERECIGVQTRFVFDGTAENENTPPPRKRPSPKFGL